MYMNHYEALGIASDADASTIKRAYHKLALKCHPDKQVSKPLAEQKAAAEQFKRINEAYTTLSDSDSRRRYDLTLAHPTASATRPTTGASASYRAPHHPRSPAGGAGARRPDAARATSKPRAARRIERREIPATDRPADYSNISFHHCYFSGAGSHYSNDWSGAKIFHSDITAIFLTTPGSYGQRFIWHNLKFLGEAVIQPGCVISTSDREDSWFVMLRLVMNRVDIANLDWEHMPADIQTERPQWQTFATHYREFMKPSRSKADRIQLNDFLLATRDDAIANLSVFANGLTGGIKCRIFGGRSPLQGFFHTLVNDPAFSLPATERPSAEKAAPAR
jgi:curved DNA-binding protein CbpA